MEKSKCQACGEPFTPFIVGQLYCSHRCRNRQRARRVQRRWKASRVDNRYVYSDLYKLDIGGHCVIPWRVDERGDPAAFNQMIIWQAIRRAKLKTGQDLRGTSTPRGVRVDRIA